MRVEGLGFRVQGSGFRVQGSGFRFQVSGFRFQVSGFRGSTARAHPAPFSPTESAVVVVVVKVDTVPPGESARGTSPAWWLGFGVQGSGLSV